MAIDESFAIFILSHGRPDRVYTYKTLRRAGYTGDIYILIDNEDQTAPQYYETYGDQVIMFDKAAVAETFDEGDNFGDRRAVVYARNACFDIARELGLTYFMQFDDDYTAIAYRMDNEFHSLHSASVLSFDGIINALLKYYKSIPAKAISLAQGGDFLGGIENDIDKSMNRRRKCMNTILCSTERPFQFVGRINEDVTTYSWFQSLGNLFMMIPLVSIQQRQTQSNAGGMTELYLDSGTYIKSFYTVMYSPSSVTLKMLRSRYPRLHHSISWEHTVPCIIREKYKKSQVDKAS